MFSRFTDVVARISTSFLYGLNNTSAACVFVFPFVYPSSVDGRFWGRFHLWTTVNRVAVSMHTHRFGHLFSIPWGLCLGVELLDHVWQFYVSHFEALPSYILQWPHHFIFPPAL